MIFDMEIPEEILLMILDNHLSYHLDFYWKYYRALLNFTMVSRAWKDMIERKKSFWRLIIIDDDNDKGRNKKMDLFVRISDPHYIRLAIIAKPSPERKKFIYGFSDRISHLTMEESILPL